MAVMDLINQAGGSPANFLDMGAAANNIERVVNTLKIVTSDPDVKAVLINIFGGITRMDVVAKGIVEAYRQMKVCLPVVIRLAGTNAEKGKRILAESGIRYIEAEELHDAALKAVEAAKEARNKYSS